MSNRAKLSRGKKVAFDPEASPNPSLRTPGSKAVILDRHNVSDSARRWTKTIVGFTSLAAFLLIFVYVGLSATLMTSVPSDDSLTERVWIARGTFTGGNAPTGSFVYASATTAKPSGPIDKILEGFVGAPQGLVAEVVAGPYGTVGSDENGTITWENKIVSGYEGTVETHLLNKEYLAKCIQGSCTAGELIYVPMSNVSGEAKSTLSFTGIRSFGE